MTEKIETDEKQKPWYQRWSIWLGLLIFDLLVSGFVVGFIESVMNP